MVAICQNSTCSCELPPEGTYCSEACSRAASEPASTEEHCACRHPECLVCAHARDEEVLAVVVAPAVPGAGGAS